MKSIFDLFLPRNTFRPPKAVVHSIRQNFGNVINVEWSKDDTFYEAVFYHLNIEKIARFSAEGDLLETKVNLPLYMAKPEVAVQAKSVGELMNLIEINRHGTVFYDIVARDKNLERYYLLLAEDGTLLEKNKL
jgi:hypothetical protein